MSAWLPLVDWFMLPIDPARGHSVEGLVAWHGRLMVLAWGVLVPIGVIVARFFKITPRQHWPLHVDNQAWWIAHRVCQYVAAATTVVALGFILAELGSPMASGLHALFGWTVVALLCIQLLGGWFRGTKGGPTHPAPDGTLRGDHYDMTRRRRIFERLHKGAGYLVLLVSACAIGTGLWRVNAPRGFWLLIGSWWVLCAIIFAVLQRRGFAIDTYQAIWGPDRAHPGNTIAPIGWGIRRLGSEERPH